MSWLRLLYAVLAVCLGLSTAALAQQADSDTDAADGVIDQIAAMADPLVRMKVTPVGDGLVRDSEWSTLHVRLANLGDPLEGQLILRTRTSAGEDLVFRRRVELPAGARKDVSILYKPGIGGTARTLTWDAGRRSLTAQVPIRFVGRDDVAIGVLGTDSAGVQVLRETWHRQPPARQPMSDLEPGATRTVWTGQIPVPTMPDRVQGYDVFNWLVWVDADPSALSAEQAEALKGWVAGGGHLLLTVTEKWRQTGQGPLSDLLPVELSGTTDGYGAWAMLGNRSADGGTEAPQAQASVRDVDGRTITSLVNDGPDDIWTIGTFGLGTVHVVAVDPRLEPLRSGMNRVTLWRRLLWLPEPGATAVSPVPLPIALQDAMDVTLSADPTFEDAFVDPFAGETTGWIGQINQFLIDIPGVAPIPISWLLAFAGVYLFVIGPLDYFVLRALRRQPLTWITFPITIAVFSGLALLGTSYVKGSQAVVTRYEVVDILPGTGRWRGASWYGVWSTRRTSLSMTSGVGDGLAEPLDIGGYQKNVEVLHGTAGSALGWEADTWTLSYARTTWTERNAGTISARQLGDGTVEVTNNSGLSLRDAVVIIGGDEFWIDDLADGRVARTRRTDVDNVGRTDYPSEALELEETWEWARDRAIYMPETRRGLLRFDQYDAVVVGLVEAPIEDSVLEGLTPSPRTLTVLRAPVTYDDPDRSETP